MRFIKFMFWFVPLLCTFYFILFLFFLSFLYFTDQLSVEVLKFGFKYLESEVKEFINPTLAGMLSDKDNQPTLE